MQPENGGSTESSLFLAAAVGVGTGSGAPADSYPCRKSSSTLAAMRQQFKRPRAWIVQAGIVSALLAVPSLALAVDLSTGGGFIFDVQDNDGALLNGSSDAYDTAYRLYVNGTLYTTGSPSTVSADGRHVYMPPEAIGGLTVERYVYVPATGGDYARYIDVVTNMGASTVSASIEIRGNLGSDSATTITGSSSGDTTATLSDDWFSTDDATDGGGDPSLGHVVQGPGARTRASALTVSSDNLSWTFDVTVPAGGRAAVLTFAVQAPNRAASIAEATRLAALPPDTLVGVDPYAADIVNFQFGGAPFARLMGPSEVDEGDELTIEAVIVDLEDDSFTWSWDLDGDGVFGELANSSTYVVPAGTTDGDSMLEVAVEATDGTNSRITRKRILIKNVPPTITSEPPTTTSSARYEYQVEAEDPAGPLDPLVFRLGGSVPSGMEISETGLITWLPPPTARGRTHTAIVQVLDGDLGQDLQTWEIRVGGNAPPESPTPFSPIDFARVSGSEPVTLIAENATDPDGDALFYTFEVSQSSSFHTDVLGSGEVPEGEAGMTSWTTAEPLAPGAWHWRVSASDRRGTSLPRFGSFRVDEPEVMEDAGTPPVDGGLSDGGVTPASGGCSASPASNGAGLPLLLAAAMVFFFLRRREVN